MSGLGSVLPAVISPVGAALGLFKPVKPAVATPLPQATPRANSAVMDALARRTGSAANMRTGAMGAESSAGKKTLMGT